MRACPPCSYLSIFAQKLLLYRILASKTSAVLVTGMSCSMLTLYMSHVHSIPEFNSPVWNPTKVGKIQAMLGVQKTFTSRFSALRSHDYWKLKEMSFMSQQRRRERYIILKVSNFWTIKPVTPPFVKGCSQQNQSQYVMFSSLCSEHASGMRYQCM